MWVFCFKQLAKHCSFIVYSKLFRFWNFETHLKHAALSVSRAFIMCCWQIVLSSAHTGQPCADHMTHSAPRAPNGQYRLSDIGETSPVVYTYSASNACFNIQKHLQEIADLPLCLKPGWLLYIFSCCQSHAKR